MKINLSKRTKVIIAGILLFILTSSVSWYAFARNQPSRSDPIQPSPTPSILDERAIPSAPEDLVVPSPSPSDKNFSTTNNVNVLLLGYGGPGHEGGFLTDVILLAKIDFKAKKITLVHIPRDVWISLPSGSTSVSTKINAALPMGLKQGNYPTQDVSKDAVIRGAYLTKQAVNQVTGIQPDLVVAIDFTRFSQAINALQGIDVTILKTLDDPWYPITGEELNVCGKSPEEVTQLSNQFSGFELEKQFPCRYEHLHFDPGIIHMDGDTALKFTRSRHTTSDFDRGERQIQVLLAIKDKLFSLKALDNIPEFFSILSKAVKTDITKTIVEQLAPRLAELPQFEVVKISLSTANVLSATTTSTGASALVPKAGETNFQGIHDFINR